MILRRCNFSGRAISFRLWLNNTTCHTFFFQTVALDCKASSNLCMDSNARAEVLADFSRTAMVPKKYHAAKSRKQGNREKGGSRRKHNRKGVATRRHEFEKRRHAVLGTAPHTGLEHREKKLHQMPQTLHSSVVTRGSNRCARQLSRCLDTHGYREQAGQGCQESVQSCA